MNNNQTSKGIAWVLSVTFVVIGVSFILGANQSAINNLTNIYQIQFLLPTPIFSAIAGLFFIFSGIITQFSLSSKQYTSIGVVTLAVLAFFPIFSLLSESRWLSALGGFPIIGSGQGIIKYFALLPLIAFLFYYEKFTVKQHIWFNFLPAALVMLWIGGMKFYEFEAKGIESLITTSPLMSWMYDVWDLQTTSNIIGIYDILVTFLLFIGILFKQKFILYVGITGTSLVFLTTQTFMFSTGSGFSAETLITGLSHFVLKDLWLLMNLVVIFSLTHSEK